MDIIIMINGVCKRFKAEKPINCSDSEMVEWLFSELQQRTIRQGNRLEGLNLGKLTFIHELKCQP